MNRVIFRKWRGSIDSTLIGDVIAFLPDVEANPGRVMSYEHMGQHGEADYYLCLAKTQLATPQEYGELLAELETIGYDDLVVRKKLNNH